MEELVRKQVVRRLNYIGGHVAGIQRMTARERDCVDLLKQCYAVRKSLEKLEAIILESHLRSCVGDEIGEHPSALVEELVSLYAHSTR